MHADTLKLHEVFGKKCQYAVPHYQRPYVWKREEQWVPLWEDLRLLAEDVLAEREVTPHFLGAIVLEQIKTSTRRIETRYLIDGQQRMTTLQLVFEAFHDLCEDGIPEVADYGQELHDLTRNKCALSKDEDDQYKVWPTHQDRAHFRTVMSAVRPDELHPAYGAKPGAAQVGQPIADAYLFFHETIRAWLNEVPPDARRRVEALFGVLHDQVRMVVIDLGEGDDPQMIFETLNARGTPLLPTDLVKNLLFHRAITQGEDSDELYQRYWRPFDDEERFWRKEIGRGRLTRARIDIFLQLYMSRQLRDDVQIGHLYTRFRRFAAESLDGMARRHMEALAHYAAIYRDFDREPEGSREHTFFLRIAAMDTATVHPFLLEMFSLRRAGRLEAPAVREVLETIESFLVRRMLCQMSTKGYNRLFIDLLETLDGEPAELPSRVRCFFTAQGAESLRWPTDDEFRRAWMETPIYDRLQTRRVAMVLAALEAALVPAKMEAVSIKEALTTEHLLPQTWKEDAWPLPPNVSRDEATADRQRVLHTFGNLTLVNKRLNPSLSNSAWPVKRSAIQKYSVLALNKPICEEEAWTESVIRRRGEALFRVALCIWPGPAARVTEAGFAAKAA